MKGRISKPGEAYLHYHSSYLYSWLVHLTGTQHINEASISTNAAFPLLSPPGTTRKTMFDTLWQQRYLMGRLGGKKAGCELVKNICIVGGRLSDSRYWVWTRMSVGGNKGLSCSANLPRMCKDHINQCCCPSRSPIAVSSQHSPVELPFSCVWLVLLLFSPVGSVLHSLSISWASHIRRTSGVRHQEWSLWGTTLLPPPAPTHLCLSLFIFQPFSSSLPLAF